MLFVVVADTVALLPHLQLFCCWCCGLAAAFVDFVLRLLVVVSAVAFDVAFHSCFVVAVVVALVVAVVIFLLLFWVLVLVGWFDD